MNAPLLAPPPRLSVPVAPAERPVELTELRVSAEVSGGLAVTTWELAFHNPNSRVLEGQLEFPLLDGQTIVRFALDIDGVMRDAVPVPKDKGRQVFEDIVRRGVDPGLLEKTAGNSYRARVYPLLPQQTRRVVIAYQEAIASDDGEAVYRLALDLPRLKKFSLALAVRGPEAARTEARDTIGLSLPAWRNDQVITVEKADFTARGLLELLLPSSGRPTVTTEEFAGKTYFRAEQALALRARPRPRPRVLGVLWDSSGSSAGRDLAREFAAMDRYFAALGDVEVRLVRLRDAAEPTETFTVKAGDWSALRRALDSTLWDGATALSAWQPEAGVDAWLLCTDGLVNFGAPDPRPDTHGAPLHALPSTARADPARLRGLADATGGEFVDLLTLSAAAAADKLLNVSERLLALDTSPREVTHVYPEAPAPLPGARLVLAGVLRSATATLRARVGFPDDPSSARTIEIPLRADDQRGKLAARAWAALKIAALEPAYATNQADIERTGQDFGIVTRGTSLIVLESLDDYLQYDIAPPEPLRAAWDRKRDKRWRAQEASARDRLEHLVALFKQYVDWWERDFSAPPEKPPLKKQARPEPRIVGHIPIEHPSPSRARRDESEELERERGITLDDAPSAPPPPSPAAAPMAEITQMDEMPSEAAAEEAAEGGSPGARAAIQLQRWTADAPYLDRLRRTADARLYHVYLEEAIDYARSTAFFLDAADLFYERGMPALGLRALSNLAEMELDNPAVLRILGYRLLQAGRPDLARPVFAQVQTLRPEEPQSYRDLAQACAALGETQAAIDLLWEVAIGKWDGRFPEIELIALVELNALIATSKAPLDLARIDSRVRRALPLDLRVVLTWDADNTDIDLWVTDPSGEKAYYGNRLTRHGGRMSCDFRQGYGPEEFSLKKAVPGVYTVEANFYGNSQQIIAGATTIQLQFITGFAAQNAQEQRVTMRLRDTREVVTVGRFTVE
jgi:Ca-activated chloride channel family protein